MPDKINFGFKKVDKSEKAGLVRGVFDNVASRYDIMNDAMSFGTHRLWKDKFINMLAPKSNTKLLDVAGGTGDIAFRFLKKSPTSEVTICDINHEMLKNGVKSGVDKNIINNIEWVCGDAMKLPVPDNYYDYYTIAFGIRNVTDINIALKEAYRVLKPGGKFMCLEFSNIDNIALSKLYNFYSFNIIPNLGKLIANDKDSYQYLVESIKLFPKQQDFLEMIEQAGFKRASYQNLSFGVVAIHSGWKI